MRFVGQRRHQQEEAESAFVSMTDMTVSFLFVMMILLAFFASQYNETNVVARPVYDTAVQERDAARAEVERLETEVARLTAQVQTLTDRNTELEHEVAELRAQLAEKDPIEVYNGEAVRSRSAIIEALAEAVRSDILREKIEGLDVSAQGDALRFQGAGLFASGQGGLSGPSLRIIHLLGDHLARQLPCFTTGPRSDIKLSCNPDLVLVETVQVEGHTDSDSWQAINLSLSMQRALSAFTAIAPDQANDDNPPMLAFENLLGQPVLAMAGYGEMRPISDNSNPEGKASNRRIDLRFIMYVPPGKDLVPHKVSDIERISTELKLRGGQQ